MSEGLTKSAARNIFFGGTIFFFVVFIGLVAHSHLYVVNVSSNDEGVTEAVAAGKKVWEKHSCINCHTIMGEGAYYAPELANVWVRYGGKEDPESAAEGIKTWMQSQPTGIEGRRQMPQFNLTDEELDNLNAFFKWVSEVDTQNWPPHPEGY